MLGGLFRRSSQFRNRVAFDVELRLRVVVRPFALSSRFAGPRDLRFVPFAQRRRFRLLVLQRAQLLVESIEFLAKRSGLRAFSVQIVSRLVGGPFEHRRVAFQLGSGSALFRKFGLDSFASLIQAFFTVVLQDENSLLRLFQQPLQVGARRGFLIDGSLRQGARLPDVHLGFEPRIGACLHCRRLRLLTRHACKIENQCFQRVTT